MSWQFIAMWVVVAAAVIWFVRDERRRRADEELALAARYYAHAPRFRHVATPPIAPLMPQPRQQSLLRSDRAYFEQFLGKRPRR